MVRWVMTETKEKRKGERKRKVGAGDLCQVTWRKGVRAVLGRRQPVASRATSKALRQGPVLAERARCPVSDRQGAVSQKSN